MKIKLYVCDYKSKNHYNRKMPTQLQQIPLQTSWRIIKNKLKKMYNVIGSIILPSEPVILE